MLPTKIKVFILCGGSGSRLDKLGKIIAKPMVRIGKEPMLYHIISNFVKQGFKDFVLCTGHRSETINNYFLNENKKHVEVVKKNKGIVFVKYKNKNLKFNCNIVFTGKSSGTGGRIKSAVEKLKIKEDILMTYGDGLSNVDIKSLIKFHYKNKASVTMTGVRPKHKYGIINTKKNLITSFDDSKTKKIDSYINGGFFIISRWAYSLIKKNYEFWEDAPLKKAIIKNKVYIYRHKGFWQCVDTLKDLNELNSLFKSKKLPWLFKK